MLRRRLLDRLDVPTIAAAFALVAIGMTAIASATAEQPARAGLWKVQLAWLGIASVAAIVEELVDHCMYQRTRDFEFMPLNKLIHKLVFDRFA